jgi:hypothetical protein
MRKRYRVLVLAALVAALVVPVGFALSLETPAFSSAVYAPSTATAMSPAAFVTSRIGASLHPSVADAAKLLLVGTTLFGVAAFLRKSA